ncbi:MAG: pyridoxamine 5'-phosphate oxidase family protein, partial [Clostridia bacterium]|nr:pyridoxamine 5'-phosphate oxidase family protein [Clostridia bacterium]
GEFWLFSEGGLKFRALAGNRSVCLAIYDPYSGFSKLGGMQIAGKAEIAEPWSEEYLDLLAFRKIPVESLKKLPHALHLIRVTPTRIDFLWSEFKKLGYDSRQHLILFSH